MNPPQRLYHVDVRVWFYAPDDDGAERIAQDVARAARRTNCYVRDGRITNALALAVRHGN